MTSNVSRDSIPDVNHVQTSANIYNGDNDVHLWLIITPHLVFDQSFYPARLDNLLGFIFVLVIYCGLNLIYANLVNFEVYLKVPVSLDKMVKVWMLKNLCLIAQ